MIQLTSAYAFIDRLTKNRLSSKQINRSLAYLRAKQVVFFDTWGEGEHVLILADAEKNKPVVIESLKIALS